MIVKVRFPQIMLKSDFNKLGGVGRLGEFDIECGQHYGKICHMTKTDHYKDEVTEMNGYFFFDDEKVDSFNVYERTTVDYVYIIDDSRCSFIVVLEDIAKLSLSTEFKVEQILVPETFHKSLWQRIKELF